VSPYGLTRDDGALLLVPANAWEASLELAYVHGWRPAGTTAPLGLAGHGETWSVQDYFTHRSQHVGRADARALGQALELALRRRPESSVTAPGGTSRNPSKHVGRSLTPPIELNGLQRKAMVRFAAFAQLGGFTIHGT
jgi:hypothetical protein